MCQNLSSWKIQNSGIYVMYRYATFNLILTDTFHKKNSARSFKFLIHFFVVARNPHYSGQIFCHLVFKTFCQKTKFKTKILFSAIFSLQPHAPTFLIQKTFLCPACWVHLLNLSPMINILQTPTRHKKLQAYKQFLRSIFGEIVDNSGWTTFFLLECPVLFIMFHY